MGKECEFHFSDLDPTIEQILTIEPTLDFSELVMVPEPIIFEPKSTISQNHILLLNQCVDYNDSVMIF